MPFCSPPLKMLEKKQIHPRTSSIHRVISIHSGKSYHSARTRHPVTSLNPYIQLSPFSGIAIVKDTIIADLSHHTVDNFSGVLSKHTSQKFTNPCTRYTASGKKRGCKRKIRQSTYTWSREKGISKWSKNRGEGVSEKSQQKIVSPSLPLHEKKKWKA